MALDDTFVVRLASDPRQFEQLRCAVRHVTAASVRARVSRKAVPSGPAFAVENSLGWRAKPHVVDGQWYLFRCREDQLETCRS